MTKNHSWTPYEDRRLRELAPYCTIAQIARRIGRPAGGVRGRASALDIEVTSSLKKLLARQRRPRS